MAKRLFLEKIQIGLLAGTLAFAPAIQSAEAKNSFSKHFTTECSIQPASKATCSDKLVQNIISKYWKRYLEKNKEEFIGFCWQHRFDTKNERVQREYATARFLHDLIKANGILENHVVDEKDRHKLKRVLKGTVRPIDDDASHRYPSKMMRDLFSDSPRYLNPSKDRFHVFGDCDEFEMLYVTLLRYAGMDARVIMVYDNHVETLLWINGKEMTIDNRFGMFGLDRVCKRKCVDHVGGEDAKKYIKAINRIANVKAIVAISPEAIERIDDAIRAYLK